MKPTIIMMNTAGPSPASAKEKSSPQLAHRGPTVRKPSNRRPSPQRGQRPRQPTEIGCGGERALSSGFMGDPGRRPVAPNHLPSPGRRLRSGVRRSKQAIGPVSLAKANRSSPLMHDGAPAAPDVDAEEEE